MLQYDTAVNRYRGFDVGSFASAFIRWTVGRRSCYHHHSLDGDTWEIIGDVSMARCHHCNREVSYQLKRRLCKACYTKPAIQEQYPPLRPGRRTSEPEPTMEQIDKLIAVQMQSLPKWWDNAWTIYD